jgi:kynurenine formamidase
VHEWPGGFIELSAALPAVEEARVYDLAVRLEEGMARHPAHPPYAFVLTKKHGEFSYPNGISSVSELFAMGAHVGTHVDALGHIGCCGEIHGGHRIADHQSISGGLQVGSAEQIPPLLGTARLLDAEALFGRELTPADEIGPEQLDAWFADHQPPTEGELVVIRTGWMKYWDDADRYIGLETGLPGLTRTGAEWLSARGILAVGSDTMNLEHKKPGGVCLDVHVHLLVEKGIYIIESLDLEQLAADGVTDFTFVAAALRLKGASGSPIRPLAIVQPNQLDG